ATLVFDKEPPGGTAPPPGGSPPPPTRPSIALRKPRTPQLRYRVRQSVSRRIIADGLAEGEMAAGAGPFQIELLERDEPIGALTIDRTTKQVLTLHASNFLKSNRIREQLVKVTDSRDRAEPRIRDA